MLKRKILLTSALVGAELVATALAAQAGGMAGFHMPSSVNVSNVSSRLGALNCRTVNTGHSAGLHVYGSGGGITNNVNRSTNINVNKSLNVYSPVSITNNIDRSTNISANVNIDNSKYIDTSTNISVNKDINIRTTNIFNGMGSGSDHSQGGSWGSHTGNMGGGSNHGGGSSHGGGGSNNGGGSNQNNNGNSNSNGNSNGNSNENNIDNSSNNTINNNNSINASAAIDSFFNGLRGWQ